MIKGLSALAILALTVAPVFAGGAGEPVDEPEVVIVVENPDSVDEGDAGDYETPATDEETSDEETSDEEVIVITGGPDAEIYEFGAPVPVAMGVPAYNQRSNNTVEVTARRDRVGAMFKLFCMGGNSENHAAFCAQFD